MTIHKFQIDAMWSNEFPAHKIIRWLDVQIQHGRITLWAQVDEDSDESNVRVCIRGTGHTMDGKEGEYIGTVQYEPLVWHVFEAES